MLKSANMFNKAVFITEFAPVLTMLANIPNLKKMCRNPELLPNTN